MADEGISYFPLHCTLDEKFELLEAEYGLKGFAIVVKLFQRIYKEHGYYCEWNDDISLMFAKQCGFSNVGASNVKCNSGLLGCADASSQPGRPRNLIDHVVAASIRRGIFDSKLFEECSILTSRGIQRNFLNIVRNRKKVEIKKDYLLLSDAEIKGNVVIIDESYVRNCETDVRFKQSKVKESKVYKTENAREEGGIRRFEEFLSAYPKSSNRHLTETAYADLVIKGLETEDNLVSCAINYADACKLDETPERYIKSAQNFLKDLTFERYLPGKYKKPAQQKPKNRFNDFEQRGYDYAALERQLLGKQGDKGRR